MPTSRDLLHNSERKPALSTLTGRGLHSVPITVMPGLIIDFDLGLPAKASPGLLPCSFRFFARASSPGLQENGTRSG